MYNKFNKKSKLSYIHISCVSQNHRDTDVWFHYDILYKSYLITK